MSISPSASKSATTVLNEPEVDAFKEKDTEPPLVLFWNIKFEFPQRITSHFPSLFISALLMCLAPDAPPNVFSVAEKEIEPTELVFNFTLKLLA